MGDIYRATDSVLGREVAVKILAERYSQDQSVRQRFKREALAAARLSGEPNIVTIFDVGEHHERPYIVMEYLPGGSLDEVLRKGGAQQPQQVFAWLEQAGRALDTAHERGVVHRDVKPGNLMLDREGNVYVADFGIASAAGMDSLTMTGTVLGTAGYLAPEQAQAERATAASDRYALAVVGFELLTGSRPFAAGMTRPLAAAAPTAVTQVVPRPPASRNLRPLLFALLAAGALAGILLAWLLTRDGSSPSPTVVTTVRTVTTQGQVSTVQRTVTTSPTTSAPTEQSGKALNDAGFAKMQAGDFQGALPLLERAVQKLDGTGSLDEAYAKY